MNFMDVLKLLASVISGLAVCIPLVVKLVEAVKDAVKARNVVPMMQTLLNLMEDAEGMFEHGADKKAYVMSMVEQLANSVEYELDMDIISHMIDDLCDMSKVVNAPEQEPVVESNNDTPSVSVGGSADFRPVAME